MTARERTLVKEAEVWDLVDSEFGAHLFNIYTLKRQTPLLFSSRRSVVSEMIRAMLMAEAAEFATADDESNAGAKS